MPTLTLSATARRIVEGVDPRIAIKEHIDEWNRSFDPELYAAEPPLTNQPYIDAWLAGAAEYEAFMIDLEAPTWASAQNRFLAQPFFLSESKNSKNIAIAETPFAFRRRMVFSGRTFIKRPSAHLKFD